MTDFKRIGLLAEHSHRFNLFIKLALGQADC